MACLSRSSSVHNISEAQRDGAESAVEMLSERLEETGLGLTHA